MNIPNLHPHPPKKTTERKWREKNKKTWAGERADKGLMMFRNFSGFLNSVSIQTDFHSQPLINIYQEIYLLYCSHCLPPAKSQKANAFFPFPHREIQMQRIPCNASKRHLVTFRHLSEICKYRGNCCIPRCWAHNSKSTHRTKVTSASFEIKRTIFIMSPHYFQCIYLSINVYSSILSIRGIKMYMTTPTPSILFIKSSNN